MKKIIIATFVIYLTNCSSPITEYNIPYTIADEKQSYEFYRYNIIIPKVYQKDSLIEIARRLKTEKQWDGVFQVYFYQDSYIKNKLPKGHVVYVSTCKECANDKDCEGNDVEATINQPIF